MDIQKEISKLKGILNNFEHVKPATNGEVLMEFVAFERGKLAVLEEMAGVGYDGNRGN